jgi:hypothetical protein
MNAHYRHLVDRSPGMSDILQYEEQPYMTNNCPTLQALTQIKYLFKLGPGHLYIYSFFGRGGELNFDIL